MKRLSVLLLVAMMVFSVTGVSMAAVGLNGYAIYTYDAEASDDYGSSLKGKDMIDFNLFFNSKINNESDVTVRFACVSNDMGYNIGIREAYTDIKKGFGDLRLGDWETKTWETALFTDEETSFGRMKGWAGIGYTSPDLGLKGLKLKAVYFLDSQNAGDTIYKPEYNYNDVEFQDNAYVATIEYKNDWLTANGNLIDTKIKDPKWDKSYGLTLNIIAKTPLEGLRAVLYSGRDAANYEMVIAGLWYQYQALGFRYERDVIDDIKTTSGDNRSAYEFSYSLPNGIELQYRYRDLRTKYNEIRAIVRFK
jgi:hypothetical protein